MTVTELNREIGNIDIFILDQILKGRFKTGMQILDAGCGEGRNLFYFLKNDFEISAIDQNKTAVKMVRMHARTQGSKSNPSQFIEGDLSAMPFPDAQFDAVICISVLHFANGTSDFENMLIELIRILKSRGILFLEMDALFGLEGKVKLVDEGIYVFPDDTRRFLFTENIFSEIKKRFYLLEPVRYELIDGKRSAVKLVLEKSA